MLLLDGLSSSIYMCLCGFCDCLSVKYLLTLNSTIVYSLRNNGIGDKGAAVLADVLKVNQSLKTLE